MKKLFLMASIAVLALAVGCSKDQTTDNTTLKKGTLRAIIEQQTRTALDGVNVVWSKGNAIAVLNADNSSVIEKHTISSGVGTVSAVFSGKELSGEGDIYALYPYDAGVSFAESKFNFTLPATQTFRAGGFANNVFPMVGKCTPPNNNIDFKNLMGVVVFKVISPDANQKVASLTVTTAGEKIAGAASVAMNYTDAPKLVMDANGTTEITLTNVNATLSATPTEFYIALPTGRYEAGMTFALKDAEGTEMWSKTTTKPLTVTRSHITPLTVMSLGAFFPDANFRKHLVELGFVETADGTDIDITNTANIEKFKSTTIIECASSSIASLKGIEFFTALIELQCYYNQLTSLDFSKNTKLETLQCYGNVLTSLDVSKCIRLTGLNCYSNELTTLDVSKCIRLKELTCELNHFTSVDLSKNTALTSFQCNNGKLTSLDVSNNTALVELWCAYNELTTIDVSKNTKLKYFMCYYNELTTIDVSNNTKLESLECSGNKLTSLDVSNNTKLEYLECADNKLTSLDVSKNTQLTLLRCYGNRMSELDICSNTMLDKSYTMVGKQTTDGTTALQLTLWLTQAQLAAGLGTTGRDNANVTPTVKP